MLSAGMFIISLLSFAIEYLAEGSIVKSTETKMYQWTFHYKYKSCSLTTAVLDDVIDDFVSSKARWVRLKSKENADILHFA